MINWCQPALHWGTAARQIRMCSSMAIPVFPFISQEEEEIAKPFTCLSVFNVAKHRQSGNCDPQVFLGSGIIISRQVVTSQQWDPAPLIHLESKSIWQNYRQCTQRTAPHKLLLNKSASMEEVCPVSEVLSHPPLDLLSMTSAGRWGGMGRTKPAWPPQEELVSALSGQEENWQSHADLLEGEICISYWGEPLEGKGGGMQSWKGGRWLQKALIRSLKCCVSVQSTRCFRTCLLLIFYTQAGEIGDEILNRDVRLVPLISTGHPRENPARTDVSRWGSGMQPYCQPPLASK